MASVSTAARSGSAPAAPERWRPHHNPWAVALTVTMATFMEILDTSIANVALPHIAGGLAASENEATWVLTSYLVSNAIVLPISAWLSSAFGRKRFYMSCVALFTLSSFLCGFAPTLGGLIVFRIMQGAGGGGLQPSEQAILADTFPPEGFGMAFAVYGMAVVLAPAIGPTLGGWITDNYSWRWIFFINIPVGIASLLLSYRMIEDPPYLEQLKEDAKRKGIDYVGLSLIVLGIGALQIVLDKGQEDDWFQSHFITALAVICAISLVALTLWEWFNENPVIELRMLKERTFATASLMIFMLGLALYGTTVLLPLYLQDLMGWTAELSGMVLSPGAVAIIVCMPLVGWLVHRVDARWLIVFGFTATAASLYHMTSLDPEVDFNTAMLYRVYQSIGLAFLFIPINRMSYVGVPQEKNNQISSMINLFRNIGGSAGIAAVATLVARRAQVHQARLVVHATGFDPAMRATLNRLAAQFLHGGASRADAMKQAYGEVYRMIGVQASALAYVDVLYVFTLLCLAMVPLVFLMKHSDPHAADPAMAH